MRSKSRQIWWIWMIFLGLSAIGGFTNFFLPDSPLTIGAFFGLVFVTLFFFWLVVFNHPRRAFFITAGICFLLLLRLLQRLPVFP